MDALVQTNKVSRTEHRNYKLLNRGKKCNRNKIQSQKL